MPKIRARFRKRQGIPYAIEQLGGQQFRCRHCNKVFFSEKELNAHIGTVLKSDDKTKFKISASSPKLSSNVDVRVLYTYDISDRMKRQWLKLKKGDQYDGIQ